MCSRSHSHDCGTGGQQGDLQFRANVFCREGTGQYFFVGKHGLGTQHCDVGLREMDFGILETQHGSGTL